jgi:Icc-related predicted phosphoesterase
LIRIAAVGDVHVGRDVRGFEPGQLERLHESADLLLIAGDLTQHGHAAEAALLAGELRAASVPVAAVLGNHDYHHGEQARIRVELERTGVHVLECESALFEIAGVRVGVAGAKGFGGGFEGACASEFGEPEMKDFVRHSRLIAEMLATTLLELKADVKLALTHYSPARGTLRGEPLELYPFLGSYFLGEAVDSAGCAAAFHGHAHSGSERAVTAAGVPVRNVARPVIELAYKVYTLSRGAALEDAPRQVRAASSAAAS